MAYSIGIDFGTESGRVLLLNLESGEEVTTTVELYESGVIDHQIPYTGEKLPTDWALQDPMDYVRVIEKGIPQVLKQSGINPDEVIGLGVDFTSCTVIPVNKEGIPLCALNEWKTHPHAWPKLWKHHAAQVYANHINEQAELRHENFISRYGGRVSSEWYYPKLLEIFNDDREIYEAMYAFVEATDWIVWYLTGNLKRNSCTAGYKALWSDEEGFPSTEFFLSIHDEFTQPFEKIGDQFYSLGTKAGFLQENIAIKLGISLQTAVAVGNVDAHVSVPGAGVSEEGTLVMVMGTSICHLTVNQKEVRLPGITGVVNNGVLPGFFGYEAGQAAVGDMFAWFVEHAVPSAYEEAAKIHHQTIYELMESLASKLNSGESGLVAIDWWNGNRSIIGDANLSGVIIGYTLKSKPEEIYRALLESTAFGTRKIVENFENHNIPIQKLVACGGLSFKSSLLMQIYADVCGIPVYVMGSTEIPARGAALFGAVAAGGGRGGFNSIQEAAVKLAPPLYNIYHPNLQNHSVYDQLYRIYNQLYEYFGVSEVGLIHEIKNIRMRNLH